MLILSARLYNLILSLNTLFKVGFSDAGR